MVAFSLRKQQAQVRVTSPEVFFAQKFSDVAVLIDCALHRTSGQCKKPNIVDRTHPALVRAVLQKKTDMIKPSNCHGCVVNGWICEI